MRFYEHWGLDPQVTYLNHGAFGACPTRVLEGAHALERRLEREPTLLLGRELESLLDAARAATAEFLGCEAADLVFVQNATTGVNSVLASFPFEPGDELLITNHGYNACSNAALFWAERRGAVVRCANVPFPCSGFDEVMAAICSAVSPRTRLLLVDHVTSPTGLVFPLAQLVQAMQARGVRVLVDGAHAPGMLDLKLSELAADYYTGNLHKWCCAPKGAAFLHVNRQWQEEVRPLVISHGASAPRRERSRFLVEFGWTGTLDPSAVLSVPSALAYLAAWDWPAVRSHNRTLALNARRMLADALRVPLPCPDDQIGSLAALVLPDLVELPTTGALDPLHHYLFDVHRIEVPVFSWSGQRLLRISAAFYNELSDYEKLANVLRGLRQS